MQTLDAPIFEVNKESDFYKKCLAAREYHKAISEVIVQLAKEHNFDAKDFNYYGPFGFGFKSFTTSYDDLKAHLLKTSDRNGVYKFRKSSKLYKAISEQLCTVPNVEINPFLQHDIFGTNNLKASQWLGERLFYGVKDAEQTKQAVASRLKRDEVEPVMEVDFTDYLRLTISSIEEKEAKKLAATT